MDEGSYIWLYINLNIFTWGVKTTRDPYSLFSNSPNNNLL